MGLNDAKAGDRKQILEINACQSDRCHLEHLGFLCGEDINVITVFNGNFVIEVKGTRYAIDEKTASKILVCEANATSN